MKRYAFAYRVGMTPWEKYGAAAAESIAALLDREEADRPRPLGRALDLGCGRGQYTPELARRGWEAVGVDVVPRAVEAARRAGPPGVTYVVGDVTALPSSLGGFDFFLDVGCFQGFGEPQRMAQGRSITALANPGATLLMLEFGATLMRSVTGGVTQAEVEQAFPGWELLSVEAASTASLGWPLDRTSPQWYRLRLRT
ncbi:MAG TPA: class I SAM-dependent methyltransferase [Actinomycetes bacterium]|nr:class I SAM-dependent methyltransferase [Actinomycetes bacterium]